MIAAPNARKKVEENSVTRQGLPYLVPVGVAKKCSSSTGGMKSENRSGRTLKKKIVTEPFRVCDAY